MLFSHDPEVGYLRVVTEEHGEETRYGYGRLHIVLKKISGQWKIAQDWDTNSVNGAQVTADEFAKGTPLNLD